MPLYKHSARFHAALKGLAIIPEKPPEPPAPTYNEAQLQQRVQAARQEGLNQGHQQLAPQIQQLRQQAATLQASVLSGIEKRFEGFTGELYGRLPDWLMALMRRVLVEVTMTPEALKAIVEDTLSEISSEAEQMEIRLCPADLKLLQENDHELDTRYPKLTFREDKSLSSGDCLLHSRFGLVDARIETKLNKIIEDLKAQA